MKLLIIILVLTIIITLSVKQTEYNQKYWDNITQQCSEAGGFMNNNGGCEIK